MGNKQHMIIILLLFLLAILVRSDNIITHHIGSQNILGENLSELQLYVQDILSNQRRTTIPVATANSTSSSATVFGLVGVLDDPIRTKPSPDAEIVGRAQGFFAYSSLEEISLHMSLDLVFTGGDHNGSTLSLVGHNPYLHQYRQLAVIGGSGDFLMARGIAMVRTVEMDSSTGDAFFEYNVTVLHY